MAENGISRVKAVDACTITVGGTVRDVKFVNDNILMVLYENHGKPRSSFVKDA